MENTYRTPWARVALFFEILIPIFMFGKSFGFGNEHTIELFRAQFPTFIIDFCEKAKAMIGTGNEVFGRFIAMYAGVIIAIGVVAVLAVIMHFILRDRSFVQSLRFASVTLVPICILNGTLAHTLKTVLNAFTGKTQDPVELGQLLTQTFLKGPKNFLYLYIAFYVIAILFMGRRTGVTGWRRYALVGVGIVFMIVYMQAGLMITAAEWLVLQPKLVKMFIH